MRVLIGFVFLLLLQGCISTAVSVATLPVKVAYGVTKTAVKGTVAVAKAVIPDGDDKKEEDKK